MKKKEESKSYLIFARRFRPEAFEEVVGQEAITQILGNAIRGQRIPQSFLFAGPRGVGKTSTARILAKALNCAEGPTEKPCNQCELCREITRATSLDVLEIDGASNRGIDEIRTLRENVKFKPAASRFKIYIIDEVHMLTGEAFNALLKTLEEPPPHVKFIFATTEAHKVPLTILSRCQRFNFKRIPTEKIQAKLAEIAKAEGLKAEAKALFLIARASDGSLRDAETLLDQLSALAEGTIREEDILFALGLAGEEAYFELFDALRQKNAEKILSLVQTLYGSGKDLVQFGRALFEFFRNLLFFQVAPGSVSLIEMSPESKKRLAELKNSFSREELLLALTLLQNLQGDLRRALAPPRLILEIALLKLLHLDGLHAVEELLDQSTSREKKADSASGQSKPMNLPAKTISVPLVQEAKRPVASPAKTQAAALFTLPEVERIWGQVLEAAKAKEMSTGMFLAEAQPVEVTEDLLTLGLPEEFQFHKEMLERTEKRKMIEEILCQFVGPGARVQFVTTRLGDKETVNAPEAKPPATQLPEIVRQAMDIFQGSKVVRAD